MTTTIAYDDATTISPNEAGVEVRVDGEPSERVRRRLRPLYLAVCLQGVMLWVPVEKLFLTQIGFNAAKVGLLAAAYAVVVPFLEIPSGIVADRWSRREVLIVAYVMLTGSAVVGGLSTGVGMYLIAALLLGAFFAMQSGMVDSMIYDALVEETGSSEGFQRAIGAVHVRQSVALAASALAGGGLASLTSPRVTYFVTVPFGLAAVWALRRFDEPRTRQAGQPQSLRSQIGATYHTVIERGALRSVIVAMVLSALLLQALLEFGPLWMVALAAPALLYGPQWAGLMSAMGLGGTLAGRSDPTRRRVLYTMVISMTACSLILVVSRQPIIVIIAQVGLALNLVLIGTFLTQRMHDEIPSTIRAGVASAVGTLTWIAFLPFALTFGYVTNRSGIRSGAWMIVVVTVATAAAFCHLVTKPQHATTIASARPARTTT